MAAADVLGAQSTISRQGRRRKRFRHGNYTGYYKTRYGQAPGSSVEPVLAPRDPRVNLLQASWFEGKKCLDVGCNEGDLTLELVRRFRPRRMVGVDIDGYLVQRARIALASEISSVADAARQRAEGSLNPNVSRGNVLTTIAGGMSGVRPLMPRSLRGAQRKAGTSAAPSANRGTGVRRAVTAETTTTSVAGPGSSGGEDAASEIREERDEDDGDDVGAAGVAKEKNKNKKRKKKNEGEQQASNISRTAIEGCPPTSSSVASSSVARLAATGVVERNPTAEAGTARQRGERMEPTSGSGAIPTEERCQEPLLENQPRRMVVSSENRVFGSRGGLDEGGDIDALNDGVSGGTADNGKADTEAASFLAGCAISFWREDFVVDFHGGGGGDLGGYDVVCLFSIVKWMHINGGDEAVRNVFRKVYRLLRPGGRLILEPQPWKSYKKSARQHGSAEARAIVETIQLRPSGFPALLTGEVGFSSWEEIGVPGEGVGGFASRSVHVFVK